MPSERVLVYFGRGLLALLLFFFFCDPAFKFPPPSGQSTSYDFYSRTHATVRRLRYYVLISRERYYCRRAVVMAIYKYYINTEGREKSPSKPGVLFFFSFSARPLGNAPQSPAIAVPVVFSSLYLEPYTS